MRFHVSRRKLKGALFGCRSHARSLLLVHFLLNYLPRYLRRAHPGRIAFEPGLQRFKFGGCECKRIGIVRWQRSEGELYAFDGSDVHLLLLDELPYYPTSCAEGTAVGLGCPTRL